MRFGNSNGVLHSIPVLSIFAVLGMFLLSGLYYDTALAATSPNKCESGSPQPAGYVYTSDNCWLIPEMPSPEEVNIYATLNTASLVIDNGVVHDTIQSIYGTNYVSHTVSVSAEQIAGYTLTLSGDAQLTGPNNAKNDWSYAWDETSKADSAMSYKAMGSGINLAGTAVDSEGKVNFSKKLAFSTTFDNNATPGTYSGTATLSLVLTPKVVSTVSSYVPWDKMFYMQDMSPEACASVSIGTEKTLYDYRSALISGVATADGGVKISSADGTGDKYTVRKLADGNCWMVDNLKLDLSNISLESELSDVTSNYPAGTAANITTSGTWSSSSGIDKAQFNMNGFGSSIYDSSYGYYYSWYAATAGTATYSIESGSESSSICPKGWKIPKGGSSGDFQALYNKYTPASGWSTVNSVNGKWLGAASTDAGGAFFQAAGYVSSGGFIPGGLGGYYWSRTPNSNFALYYLYFNSNNINPVNAINSYNGLTIRCIAYSS